MLDRDLGPNNLLRFLQILGSHTASSALASRRDAGKVHYQERGSGLSGVYSILSPSLASPGQPVSLESIGTRNKLPFGIPGARCSDDAHRPQAPRHPSRVSICFNEASPLKYPEGYIWCDCLEWAPGFLVQHHFTHRLYTDTLQLVAGSIVVRHILGLAMIIT